MLKVPVVQPILLYMEKSIEQYSPTIPQFKLWTDQDIKMVVVKDNKAAT